MKNWLFWCTSHGNSSAAHSGQKPLVIVSKLTLMQPVVAQKGITYFHTTVYGAAARSSQINQAVYAIHAAAHLITHIENVMNIIVANGEIDEHFDVLLSSLHVDIINGRTAINMKARECSFN